MEMLVTSYCSGSRFTVSHIKRDFNTWADDLSKGLVDEFSPALRHHFDLADDHMWYLWPQLRKLGGEGALES